MAWTLADIPDLHGRTVVVTSTNSGIGLWTATGARGHGGDRGAGVPEPGKRTGSPEARILASHTDGAVEVLRLDLADQRQIADAAEEALERFPTRRPG